MAAQWQAAVARRSVDLDGAARGVARRGARSVAGQGPLVEADAGRNGQCLEVSFGSVQPSEGIQDGRGDQRGFTRGRTTGAVWNADLEYQCQFQLYGSGMPRWERHLLQDVGSAR